ncbi:MAG: hypothetical protein ACF8XB_12590 [Planctomycetota bacterium JB042]
MTSTVDEILRAARENVRKRFRRGPPRAVRPPVSEAIRSEKTLREWSYCAYCRAPRPGRWMYRLEFRNAPDAYACESCANPEGGEPCPRP